MIKTIKKNYLSQSLNLKKDTIDCCTSSNYDEMTGKVIVDNVVKNGHFSSQISKYPEKVYKEVVASLTNLFGDNNYFFGNGSEDLIVRINTLSKLQNQKVAVLKPLFYRIYANLETYTEIDYKNIFKSDLSGFDICWIVNPNSINDKYLCKTKIISLVNNNPNVTFIIDETSIFFFEEWRKLTLFSEVPRYPNLVVISSISKYFGVPGIRFGFGAASEKFISEINKISATFPISSIVACCVIDVLNNFEIFESYKKRIEINKHNILRALQRNDDIEIKESKLNFVVCRSKSRNLYKSLLDNDLLSFDMNEVDNCYQGWVRITVHSSDDLNSKVVQRLLNLMKTKNDGRKN